MHAVRPSSPTKTPSLSTPKARSTVWTARLVATLWKLAVKRARKLRRRQARKNTDTTFGSASNPTADDEETIAPLETDDASIMQEAALAVVASGVVSLADFEAVTGFHLSKEQPSTARDDDVCSEAATEMSDACSVADGEDTHSARAMKVSPRARMIAAQLDRNKSVTPMRRATIPSSTKRTKWVCVGYGRYERVEE